MQGWFIALELCLLYVPDATKVKTVTASCDSLWARELPRPAILVTAVDDFSEMDSKDVLARAGL